jgi:DNA polymerase-3 subunit gamma/tau
MSSEYLVIARKWRPQTFSDVAGQEPITRTLQNAIRAERIPHAFLFTGVRGVGKTTAARIFAKALNCEQGPTPAPCGKCVHCEEIAQGNSIDVLEIDGASNRGIDEIRQIIENVRYQPAKCRFKIYIIDEVHQVTKDAFNALLKTLEEPPPSVKFILATTEPHRLPATILSRCQRFDFRRISLREIVQRLDPIARSEKLKITEGALALLAREADGSMRDAQSLLEQVLAFAAPAADKDQSPTIDETSLQDILGLAQRGALYEISAAVFQGDARKCVELVGRATQQGCDVGRLARDLVEHFRNLLVTRIGASGSPLLDLPDQELADLAEQASPVSVDTLLDYFDYIAAGEEEIGRSSTPRFALESTLIRVASLPKTPPAAEWIERLERLETRISSGARGERSAVRQEKTVVTATEQPPQLRPPEQTSNSTQDWNGFVAFVGKEKKFLASHLEAATALELGAGQMKIGVSERHHLAFLQDSDNLATLRDLAKSFFAQEIAVQVVQLVAEPGRAPVNAPSAGAGDERSPMVKEALRIFGGAVRNVRRENN